MNCSSCDVHARGHIILTLIPSLAHSVAATLVRPLIPSLAAAKAHCQKLPKSPAPEAKLITEPLLSLR